MPFRSIELSARGSGKDFRAGIARLLGMVGVPVCLTCWLVDLTDQRKQLLVLSLRWRRHAESYGYQDIAYALGAHVEGDHPE